MVSVPPPSSNIDLPDFIQLAALARRSAVVSVHGAVDGELHIDGGEIVHASFGDLIGEVAVYAMLATTTRCEVQPPRPPPMRTVFLGTTNLLLEAARLQDEGTAPTPSVRSAGRASDARSQPPIAGSSEPTAVPARRSTRPALVLGGLAVDALLGLSWVFVGKARSVARLSPSASETSQRRLVASSESSGRPLELHELGPDDHRPELLEGPRPKRPAVELAVDPMVIVRLLVDQRGSIADARIYHPRPELAPFEQAAIAAVQPMRFVPATRQGHPVDVWINWPVVFPRAEAAAEAIRVKGSDTIGATLGPELAKAYRESSGVPVGFESLGSATAFVALFDGSADLGASSRPATDKELRRAKELGLELEEFVLGYDGVAIITHPSNPVAGLTLDDAARLFSGATARWPSSPAFEGGAVHVCGRPSYSGTHALFKQKVLRQGDENGGETFSSSATIFEKSEELVDAVAKDPRAIGYVGLGFVDGRVRAVPLASAPGRPFVAPGKSTVRDGTYPVYRPLLFYTRGVPTAKVADFLRFALSERARHIVEAHGFIPTDVPQSTLPSLNLARDPGESRAPKVVHLAFRAGTTLLAPEAEKQLPALIAMVRDHRRAVVVGHADAAGPTEVNENIAMARAKVVADLLKKAGIPDDALQVYGEDSAQPLSTNDTDEGRHRNRRVDVYLVAR